MRIVWLVSCGSFRAAYGVYPKLDMSSESKLITFLFFPAQCPAENCNGDRAYFFQLQIRSADEPMTTFLKVRIYPLRMRVRGRCII